MDQKLKPLVFLSGGIDSLAVLHHSIKKYGKKNVQALHFLFEGQEGAMLSASEQAEKHGIELHIFPITIQNSEKEVPFRNYILASYGLNQAKIHGCNAIVLGIKRAGQAYNMITFPDCTEVFRYYFDLLAKPQGVQVLAPFVDQYTRDVFLYCKKHKIDIRDCHSCDNLEDIHCGVCGKCREIKYEADRLGIKHARFKETDPKPYFRIEEFRIYINNLCDLDCDFCSYDNMNGYPKMMSEKTLKSAIHFAIDHDLRSIMLSGKEPLFDPLQFSSFIIKMREWGYFHDILLNTNGTKIDYIHDNIFEELSKIFYSLNYGINTRKIKSVPKKYRNKVSLYFVPMFDPKSTRCEKLHLRELQAEGFNKVYLRDNIYKGGLYASWLKELRGMGFEVEKPNVHHSCERFGRNLTLLTNGDIVGCPKDTYRESNFEGLHNIGSVTLDQIKENFARNQGKPLCSIMKKEVENESIFRRIRK